jgi:hypothetical protein
LDLADASPEQNEPTLQDKMERDRACSIGEVLQNPYVERLPTEITILDLAGPRLFVRPDRQSSEPEHERDGLG